MISLALKDANLQQSVGPIGPVGEEAEIRERLFRTSGFSFRLGEDVRELDQQLPEALALVRWQRLNNGSSLVRHS